MKDSGGNSLATFTYDYLGKRTSMTTSSGTVYFHYNGDQVIYETDANNNIVADYTWDAKGHPVTLTKNGTAYYYQLNGHGDVVKLTDASGNVVASYQYDAWGNTISQSGSMASVNPYRYAGYRYDEVTGLYYLMARYYDSNTVRFITRDTFHGFEKTPASQNQYIYCENNPINSVDPTGHNSWWNSTVFIGRIIDAGILLWSAGSVLYTQYAMKQFIKTYKNKLLYMVSGKIQSFVKVSSPYFYIATGLDFALTLAGRSIGEMIANGLDYADAWWGYPRSNGYVFG